MFDPPQKINGELANFICTIARDPLTWISWKCIDVSLDDASNAENNNTSLVCAQYIAESYLEKHNLHCFLCPPHNLYIVCKNVSSKRIKELSDYITEMVLVESNQTVNIQTYNFKKDLDAFLSKVQEQGEVGPLTIGPVSEKLHEELPRNKNIKTLLVEDDPVTRWMVRNSLKEECHLVTAPSASGACTMYTRFKPDIVFLDINLPDKSGIEVLEWILRNDPGARVVMFSSQDSLDSITNALDSGALGFVAKPFSKNSLIHYIRQANQQIAVAR